MLTQIHIRDLATIEELHLNLTSGCTMITGETGAGKSIFIEAIELTLGGRSSPSLIRAGKEKAEISLCFDVTHFPRVIECLKNLDLYHDTSECIIRRILTSDGRSRCYVNGSPAPLQLVKELGELLFHLHSQHEQQVLLKGDTQRDMLDRYADHLTLAADVKHTAEALRACLQEIKTLRERTLERKDRSDYLRFQLEELQAIKLLPGEWQALETEHHKLTHAEELLHHLQHVIEHLAEDEHNALSILNEVRKSLENIGNVEPKAKEWINTLQSAAIQLSDLESDIRNYLEKMELDPEKLASLEERVSQIFNLSRKHKISPDELIQFKDRLNQELEALNSSDDDLNKLEKESDQLRKKYHALADQLTQSRKKSAAKLEKEITTTIRSLSLPHGEFKITFESIAHDELSLHGNEKVIFLVKTNPDQVVQPLVKVISGGELSRLSLAAHLALANRTTIPTLVFDEVDTGLSGATAEKIGKLLKKLGRSYQVFCITHQPQVAACGDHHLLVEKCFVGKTTHTLLRLLNDDEKMREIARMLGGEKITEKTLEHAQEILTVSHA